MQAYRNLYLLSYRRSYIPKPICNNPIFKFISDNFTLLSMLSTACVMFSLFIVLFNGLLSSRTETYDATYTCQVTSWQKEGQVGNFFVTLHISATLSDNSTLTGDKIVCSSARETETLQCSREFIPSFHCDAYIDQNTGEAVFLTQKAIDDSRYRLKIFFSVVPVLFAFDIALVLVVYVLCIVSLKSSVSEEEKGVRNKVPDYVFMIENQMETDQHLNGIIREPTFLARMNETSTEPFETVRMILKAQKSLVGHILTIFGMILLNLVFGGGTAITLIVLVSKDSIGFPSFVIGVISLVLVIINLNIFLINVLFYKPVYLLTDSRVISLTIGWFSHYMSYFEFSAIDSIVIVDETCTCGGKRISIDYKHTPTQPQYICDGVDAISMTKVVEFVKSRIDALHGENIGENAHIDGIEEENLEDALILERTQDDSEIFGQQGLPM